MSSRVLVGGFVLAMLLPIVTTAYLGDDIFNSNVNGFMGWHQLSFSQWLAGLTTSFIRGGRFFPVAPYEVFGLFHVMPSLGAYKIFQVLITTVNVLTFFVLLRALRLPRPLSFLAVVVLLCSFQMRFYHDGLLGFSGFVEFTMELALLSLLGLVWFVRTGDVRALAGSLVAYVLGLCTYEVTYLLCFAMLGILGAELPWRRAVRLATPYFVLSFAVVCAQVYVKAIAHMPPDQNYSVSLNPSAFLKATAIQTSAAIPLTYLLVNPGGVFARGATVFNGQDPAVTIGIALLAFTCVWTLIARIDPNEIDLRTVRALAGTGLVLWITPAIMLASSARYQRELVFGLGHIPVYVEYFGVTMLILAAGAATIKRWGPSGLPARLSVSVIAGLLAVLTYSSNAAVIAKSVPDRDALANMNAGLAAGILNDLPDDAELLVDETIPVNNYTDETGYGKAYVNAKYYYFLKSGKRLSIHYVGAVPEVSRCDKECIVASNWYELINVPVGARAGYDVLGRLVALQKRYGQVRSFASQVTIFYRGVPAGSSLAVGFMEHGCKHPDRLVSQHLPSQPRGMATIMPERDCRAIEMNTIAVSEV